MSREWGLSHRNVSVVALHPGTVESAFPAPFISKSYSKRVLTAKESAAALIAVIDELRPEQSGEFFDQQRPIDICTWEVIGGRAGSFQNTPTAIAVHQLGVHQLQPVATGSLIHIIPGKEIHC